MISFLYFPIAAPWHHIEGFTFFDHETKKIIKELKKGNERLRQNLQSYIFTNFHSSYMTIIDNIQCNVIKSAICHSLSGSSEGIFGLFNFSNQRKLPGWPTTSDLCGEEGGDRRGRGDRTTSSSIIIPGLGRERWREGRRQGGWKPEIFAKVGEWSEGISTKNAQMSMLVPINVLVVGYFEWRTVWESSCFLYEDIQWCHILQLSFYWWETAGYFRVEIVWGFIGMSKRGHWTRI